MKYSFLPEPTKRWILEIIVFLLAILFLVTGLYKITHFAHFYGAINNQPLDNRLTPYLSIGIPVTEILITVALLVLKTRKIGLYASLILMAVFTGYVALVTFHYFNRTPCSCAGVIENFTWPQHLIFNLFFLAISIAGLWLHGNLKKNPDNSYINELYGAGS